MSDRQEHSESVTIINELGLHARAATVFVQLASKYPCEVFIAKKGGEEVNAKSIMGVLMLVAAQGTVVTIRCKGAQASEACEALVALINDRFGEDK